jgi:hypothetical protein
MRNAAIDRILAVLALLAALSVVGILVAGLQAGISQEPFQAARLAEENVTRLLLNPQGLRYNVGFDNAFIVLYTAFFAVFAFRVRDLVPREILGIALGALLLGALLDAIENHHILTMLYSAEHGLGISTQESQIQMLASSVKFHAVYVGSFLFAFAFARLGALGTFIALGIWCLFVPLGLLIYVTPVEAVRPLAIARGLFFVATFALSVPLFLTLARRSAAQA